jgi:hypothetical protein
MGTSSHSHSPPNPKRNPKNSRQQQQQFPAARPPGQLGPGLRPGLPDGAVRPQVAARVDLGTWQLGYYTETKAPPSQSESAALPLQCQRLAKLTAALAYARRGIYAARQSSPAASWLRPAGRRQRERRARGRWPGQLAPGDDGAAAPPLDRRRPTSCCRLLINDSNRMTAGGAAAASDDLRAA